MCSRAGGAGNDIAARAEAVVRMLLAAGADPCARDVAGATPLHYVAQGAGPSQTPCPGVLRALVDAGADPRCRDNGGRTPTDILDIVHRGDPAWAAMRRMLTDAVAAWAARGGGGSTYVCAACGASAARMKHCARCSRVYYCDAACQLQDWRAGHKQACSQLRASGGGGGSGA